MLRSFTRRLKTMFDKIKFLKASALLKSFKSNLPEGDEIELNYVDDYHSYLLQLGEQVKQDLSEFQIPTSAIKSKDVLKGIKYGQRGQSYYDTTVYQYCDPDVFRRQLDAVLIFIDTYMAELNAQHKADPNKPAKF
jgi:hypothetical protein